MKTSLCLLACLPLSALAAPLTSDTIPKAMSFDELKAHICAPFELPAFKGEFDVKAESLNVCDPEDPTRPKHLTISPAHHYDFDGRKVSLYKTTWPTVRETVQDWVLVQDDQFLLFEQERRNIQKDSQAQLTSVQFDNLGRLYLELNWKEFYPPAPDRFYTYVDRAYVFDLNTMTSLVHRVPLSYHRTTLKGDMLTPKYLMSMEPLESGQWQFSPVTDEVYGEQKTWLGTWPKASSN